jgi:putative glutamine amidotransferase
MEREMASSAPRTPRIGLTCSTTRGDDGKAPPRFGTPEAYVRCVEEAGGLAVLLPTGDASTADAYLDVVDGLLLIGGVDVEPSLYGAHRHPRLEEVDAARDRFEIALARAAVARGVPTFGICRGIQVLNVAMGGTLHQDLPSEVGSAVDHRPTGPRGDPRAESRPAHAVDVVAGSRLHGILGARRLEVNSIHHQAVARCASGLRVVATSSDGVVEGAEGVDGDGAFLVAVQWHPERMRDDPATKRLFAAFVGAAAKGRPEAGSRHAARAVGPAA